MSCKLARENEFTYWERHVFGKTGLGISYLELTVTWDHGGFLSLVVHLTGEQTWDGFLSVWCRNICRYLYMQAQADRPHPREFSCPSRSRSISDLKTRNPWKKHSQNTLIAPIDGHLPHPNGRVQRSQDFKAANCRRLISHALHVIHPWQACLSRTTHEIQRTHNQVRPPCDQI